MTRMHVLPINDVLEHDEYGEECLCSPIVTEDDLVIHNSFDGREHFEEDHDILKCKFCLTEPP